MMSKICSHRGQNQPSLAVSSPEYLKAFHRASELSAVQLALSFDTSSSSLRGHWFPPLGREDVSPGMDWIDNIGLNIGLRQEVGEEDIFRSVYSVVTRALPQLNDQMEAGKWWGAGALWLAHWEITALSGIVKNTYVCPVQNNHQLFKNTLIRISLSPN